MVTVPVLLSWRRFGVTPPASHRMWSSVLETPDLYRCLVDAPPIDLEQQSDRVGLVLLPGSEAWIAAGKGLDLGAVGRGNADTWPVAGAHGRAPVFSCHVLPSCESARDGHRAAPALSCCHMGRMKRGRVCQNQR
jgi:hypothetical protein